ncbi:MAG: sodium:proton antiporter NhaD [Acidobacteriota bacterium]|nr:sodium:proton antiporter NhaD [Acidobacteriota bacterium]
MIFSKESEGMEHGVQWIGPAILVVFCLAYALVFAEEKIHLQKSKPVMVAASIIWVLVAIGFRAEGRAEELGELLRHVLLDYTELFLFLLSAMSFVNTLVERGVFDELRARLMKMRLSSRGIYWVIGALAFVLSPIADNLTTALVMGTVAGAALGGNRKAVVGASVSVVVAANAGGAFSPFGDITTLMIWQKGMVQFGEFFVLFFPALINWLVPAAIIALTIPKEFAHTESMHVCVKRGGYVVAGMFLATIATTVTLDHVLHIPPFLGMMMGLGALGMYSYYLRTTEAKQLPQGYDDPALSIQHDEEWQSKRAFHFFNILEKVEWDTLLFFYGIILCVGGLGAVGYLGTLSTFLYSGHGATVANITIGALSAMVDNIPLTFAVLTMNPVMDHGQWLLLTLTAGVGGSLLSIGSAAGVALMGLGKGNYTFTAHLKWTWAILLGYAASIALHLVMNAHYFTS